MNHVMRVAIIGTAKVGQALGTSLIRAGHEVIFGARNATKTREVASSVGAEAAGSTADAARRADVIVLAIPFTALETVAREIATGARGKVVIDATNPIKEDLSGLANECGPSDAEQVAAILPRARVVKAFNTLFAALVADPVVRATRLDAFFATDDETAAETVAVLLKSLGFRPVLIGPLAAARQLEGMAWLNIRLQLQAGGDWRSSFVMVGAPAKAVIERRGQIPSTGGA
jgi:NADPH-dependent F420 reductase